MAVSMLLETTPQKLSFPESSPLTEKMTFQEQILVSGRPRRGEPFSFLHSESFILFSCASAWSVS